MQRGGTCEVAITCGPAQSGYLIDAPVDLSDKLDSTRPPILKLNDCSVQEPVLSQIRTSVELPDHVHQSRSGTAIAHLYWPDSMADGTALGPIPYQDVPGGADDDGYTRVINGTFDSITVTQESTTRVEGRYDCNGGPFSRTLPELDLLTPLDAQGLGLNLADGSYDNGAFRGTKQDTSDQGRVNYTTTWSIDTQGCAPETPPDTPIDALGAGDLEGNSGESGNVLQTAAVTTTAAWSSEPSTVADDAVLSGPDWVKSYPTSTSLDDLQPAFAANVHRFTAALSNAKLKYTIKATYRPPQRAYLMHWAWLIAEQHQDASDVPPMDGVNINWWHGDQASSEEAAAAMVELFQIAPDLAVPPALSSRHTQGRAVDMVVYRAWCGTITIQQADGKQRKIQTSDTANLATNPDIIDVARGYGVVHFGCDVFANPCTNPARDKNHWSTDGR